MLRTSVTRRRRTIEIIKFRGTDHQKGEHPFVRHPSYVFYRAIKTISPIRAPSEGGMPSGEFCCRRYTDSTPPATTQRQQQQFAALMNGSAESTPMNTPPVVDSVTIAPANPTTNQTLSATVRIGLA